MTTGSRVRDQVPKPALAGREMEALVRFHPDVNWSGVIEENGMGPGSPRMLATGRGRHREIQCGLWMVGEYEQFLEDGTFVLRWELHWVAGWDESNGEYRATHSDNFGHAGVMRGFIYGNRLTFESIGDSPAKIRLVWDADEKSDLVWTKRSVPRRWAMDAGRDLPPHPDSGPFGEHLNGKCKVFGVKHATAVDIRRVKNWIRVYDLRISWSARDARWRPAIHKETVWGEMRRIYDVNLSPTVRHGW